MRLDDSMKLEILEILSAFEDTKYPGDSNIARSASMEGEYVAAYFKGKNWTSLTVQSLRTDYPGDPSACLSFMTDQAFRYFFPGYMKMACLEYDSADAIFDVVVDRIFDASEGSRIREIFEDYDRAKLSAIAQYAELLSTEYCRHYPEDLAAIALSKYWHRYLPD